MRIDIPQEWEGSKRTYDQIFNPTLREKLDLAAEKYGMTYDETRDRLIVFWRTRQSFSLYGLCCYAIESPNCAVSRFLKSRDR